ncbi:hypothetical protein BGZ76_011308 [Entomortierella beljakovae]|nr:hypothetical protein BGZ76_011308 [Entomortierella beljakovae]
MSTEVANGNGVEKSSTDSGKENDNNGDPKKEVALKQLYEQSTQFNYWRYTQTLLNDMRTKVNRSVIETIQQNINDEREQATAVMYMKRFFLQNTVMDFHPKDVMLTCMFLARKTENFLMTIDEFSSVLKSSPESILNLEFLVCKNLRFHFTIHHPYRPCLGFFYDMQAVTDNIEKLQMVYESALKLVDTSLYTDLCFLYQPSQIALAAMKIAARKESYDFERYANYKFKSNESAAQKYTETLLPILLDIEKVLNEDPRCIEVEKSVATEIDKRLKMCKDPAKNTESLLYNKRKRPEPNGEDDDDDDDDKADKRAKTGNESTPE